jgi:hypothetical protein
MQHCNNKMHSRSFIIPHHHIAAATNIMLLTVQRDIVREKAHHWPLTSWCVVSHGGGRLPKATHAQIWAPSTTTGSITSQYAWVVHSKTTIIVPTRPGSAQLVVEGILLCGYMIHELAWWSFESGFQRKRNQGSCQDERNMMEFLGIPGKINILGSM